jgi:hypothetical protein
MTRAVHEIGRGSAEYSGRSDSAGDAVRHIFSSCESWKVYLAQMQVMDGGRLACLDELGITMPQLVVDIRCQVLEAGSGKRSELVARLFSLGREVLTDGQ